MKKYQIEVMEVLSRTITVEAHDEVEAAERVRHMYLSCDVVLDASDHVRTEFGVKDEKSGIVFAVSEINR